MHKIFVCIFCHFATLTKLGVLKFYLFHLVKTMAIDEQVVTLETVIIKTLLLYINDCIRIILFYSSLWLTVVMLSSWHIAHGLLRFRLKHSQYWNLFFVCFLKSCLWIFYQLLNPVKLTCLHTKTFCFLGDLSWEAKWMKVLYCNLPVKLMDNMHVLQWDDEIIRMIEGKHLKLVWLILYITFMNIYQIDS